MRCRQEKNVDKQRLFCSQLLEQRSLYPLYPSLSIPLDAGKLPSLAMREVPDLMIVATEKMRFVKEVDGVVCLSPGSLAFGNSGGTFARITVYPLKEERREGSEGEWTELGIETGEKVDSLVAKRCKVEIVNIWCVCFSLHEILNRVSRDLEVKWIEWRSQLYDSSSMLMRASLLLNLFFDDLIKIATKKSRGNRRILSPFSPILSFHIIFFDMLRVNIAKRFFSYVCTRMYMI